MKGTEMNKVLFFNVDGGILAFVILLFKPHTWSYFFHIFNIVFHNK